MCAHIATSNVYLHVKRTWMNDLSPRLNYFHMDDLNNELFSVVNYSFCLFNATLIDTIKHKMRLFHKEMLKRM